MKIYLDVIFFINFFFDFLLLFGTKYLLKEQTKLYRLILGSLIGALSIFTLFIKLTTFSLFIFKIIISMIMILVTFNSSNFFKKYLYFYILSIFLGGAMYLLNLTFSYKNKGLIFFSNGLSINIIVIIFTAPIIIYLYVKDLIVLKNNYSNYYNVDIYFNNKKYSLKGYLDTGNTIKDPYKYRSVVLLNLEKFKIKNKRCIYVPYQTINEQGLIKCYKCEKVVIDNTHIFKNLLIGDIKENINLENATCILPNTIKEDIC